MYCKKCFEFIRADCMLENDVCVFCHYNIKDWDSNGTLISKKEVIVNYFKSFNDWRKKFINYYKDINKVLKKLPKGTIQKRKIKGKTYYYLAYRKNGKAIYEYIGKKYSKELYENIEFRKKLIKKLSILKNNFYALKLTKSSLYRTNRFHIFQRDNFTCQYCGKTRKYGAKLTIDHITPRIKGGSNKRKNLITACSECNTDKNSIDI